MCIRIENAQRMTRVLPERITYGFLETDSTALIPSGVGSADSGDTPKVDIESCGICGISSNLQTWLCSAERKIL